MNHKDGGNDSLSADGDKEAKLIIETGNKEPETVAADNIKPNDNPQLKDNTQAKPNQPKLSSLDKIRQQVKKQTQQINASKQLDDEELYIAWGLYIEELRKKNNHSGIANFKSALLKIIDDNNLEIRTESNIQQKFIENERAALIEHLQSYFNNRFLTYKVIVVENENNKLPLEKHLTAKEQYLKMIEEYPLVKELKDRLKLNLEY
jgi:DNA polymerase-3 subunit gamma/tau